MVDAMWMARWGCLGHDGKRVGSRLTAADPLMAAVDLDGTAPSPQLPESTL